MSVDEGQPWKRIFQRDDDDDQHHDFLHDLLEASPVTGGMDATRDWTSHLSGFGMVVERDISDNVVFNALFPPGDQVEHGQQYDVLLVGVRPLGIYR
jgi:hypothetical protein